MTPALLERTRKRLRAIYSSQKTRAKKYGDVVPYSVDEFLAYMVPLIEQPCYFCSVRLTPKGFQVDHTTPLARGGTWTLTNNYPICTSCNRRKHALLDTEYQALLAFLNTQSDYMRTNVLARLAAGGAWLAGKF
jgi:5-methylcytosine-specific restriction endonuclease McrA